MGPTSGPVLACTAEAWGYGPAAKLLAVAKRVPAHRIAVGTGTARVFAGLNDEHYDDIVGLPDPLAVLDHPFRADHLLNVMDPCAALKARRQNMASTYVDSLHWFWRWSVDDFAGLADEAEAMVRMTRDELAVKLKGVDWHRMVPMAYLWSGRVFLQRLGDPDPRMEVFGDRVRHVGAVIDVEPGRPAEQRSGGIVSLSGGVSHVATVESAGVYAEFVERLLAGVPDAPRPLGHPAVATGGITLPSLGHDTLRSALSRTRYLLAPAGLTLALEAAASGVAVGFLPEQHGGHLSNLRLLAGADPTLYPAVMAASRLGVEVTEPATFIAEMTAAYRTLLLDDSKPDLERLRNDLTDTVRTLADPGSAAFLARRQRARLTELTGDFDGAATIAAAVSAALNGETA